MKLFFLIIFLGCHFFVFAQIKNNSGIHFQAIARNTDGSIIPEKNITIRLSIIEGSSDGKISYQEIKRVKTNVVGMFSLVIGTVEHSIIVTSGTYDKINWLNKPLYIGVEIDPEGGINFLNLGLQQMNDVPYAIVAKKIDWSGVVGLDSIINNKINIADTVAMLAGYQRKEFSQDFLKRNGSAAELINFPILNQNTTGNASTATIAGNISATSNSSLTALPNLSTVGTITAGTWSGTAISNNQLENKQITIGSTALVLGSTTTNISGINSLSANEFIGELRGNATSASNAVLAGNITATTNSTINTLPNLSTVGTIAAGTWSASVIDIAHGGTGTNQLSGILLGTNGSGVNNITTAAYGAWHDNTTQVATLPNTAYTMLYNTLDFAQGVSVVDNSKITVEKTGRYNIQFSAQLDRAIGTATAYVSIWLRKNGVDVPATCTDITIQGGTAVAATVAAWNFFRNLNANDYIEIMWSSTLANIQIQTIQARTDPVRPLIPSIILTVQQVN